MKHGRYSAEAEVGRRAAAAAARQTTDALQATLDEAEQSLKRARGRPHKARPATAE